MTIETRQRHTKFLRLRSKCSTPNTSTASIIIPGGRKQQQLKKQNRKRLKMAKSLIDDEKRPAKSMVDVIKSVMCERTNLRSFPTSLLLPTPSTSSSNSVPNSEFGNDEKVTNEPIYNGNILTDSSDAQNQQLSTTQISTKIKKVTKAKQKGGNIGLKDDSRALVACRKSRRLIFKHNRRQILKNPSSYKGRIFAFDMSKSNRRKDDDNRKLRNNQYKKTAQDISQSRPRSKYSNNPYFTRQKNRTYGRMYILKHLEAQNYSVQPFGRVVELIDIDANNDALRDTELNKVLFLGNVDLTPNYCSTKLTKDSVGSLRKLCIQAIIKQKRDKLEIKETNYFEEKLVVLSDSSSEDNSSISSSCSSSRRDSPEPENEEFSSFESHMVSLIKLNNSEDENDSNNNHNELASLRDCVEKVLRVGCKIGFSSSTRIPKDVLELIDSMKNPLSAESVTCPRNTKREKWLNWENHVKKLVEQTSIEGVDNRQTSSFVSSTKIIKKKSKVTIVKVARPQPFKKTRNVNNN